MNQDMKSNYLDRPVGFMEFTSGPIQMTKRVTISTFQCSNKVCNRSNVGVVNCVGQTSSHPSGRNDAQGLRSVNAIFHHHYRMSHRPRKLFVPANKWCCPHSSSGVCASLLSTWGRYEVEQFIPNGTKHACDVKLSHIAFWQGSLLRLRLSTSGSTSSHGFSPTWVASSLLHRGLIEAVG